jgi:polysaccharide export outer membrane protein
VPVKKRSKDGGNIIKNLMYFLLLLSAGCTSSGGVPPDTSVVTISTEEYTIGVDDVIQISVWKNPDLSILVPVRPDGMISMPLAGDVRAGGLTPTQVAADIEEILGEFLREPKVAVIVADLRSHEYLSRVRVTGAVAEPSSLTYRQGMTVLDAVLAAGGVTQFTSANKTKLYRRADDGTRILDIRLGDILTKGNLTTNYPLQPGDVITLPERSF